MPQRRASMDDVSPQDRVLFLATAALLTACFLTGGSSQDDNVGGVVTQLAALPVLLLAVLHGSRQARFAGLARALWLLAAILALPLLQLLPLPQWLWAMPAPRAALLADLVSAGIEHPDLRWTLSPAATERNLLSLLPAAAVFLAVLALGRDAARGFLWWLVGLATFSLLLATLQLAVPQDSFLNPFPQYAPAMAGVFANKNHQADMLAIAIAVAVGLFLDARRRGEGLAAGLAIVLAGLCFLVLPLVNSRAGVIIALVAVAAVMLGSAAVSLQRLRQQQAPRWVLALTLAMLAVGVLAAMAWMDADDVGMPGSRARMSALTLGFGLDNAPLGAGFGSFVPLFQQSAGEAMLFHAYINAAHNDYVQWWLEGGVPAMALLLGVLLLLGGAFGRLLRLPLESRRRADGLAALAGVLVVFLHSTVDYPLRTPALMAVFAVLAGVALACARDADATRAEAGNARNRSAAHLPAPR